MGTFSITLTCSGIMLSIFSCPKPFRDSSNIIQRNAIKSWTLLQPRPEIILVGKENGTVEVCKEFGIRHIPEIQQNEYRTPLISSIFSEAEKATIYSLMCYINADIMLMNNFIEAVQEVAQQMQEFLIVGHRWDLEIKEPIDFSGEWKEGLEADISMRGKFHAHTGIDYFVFPKGLIKDIPPFLVGRPGWDSWLIYHARSRNIPVVDITSVATVVHQNHDYSHHSEGEYGVWKGREAQYNLFLIGGYHYLYTLKDATHKLTKKGLRPNRTVYSFYRKFVTLSVSSPFCKLIYKFWRKFSDVVRS